MDPITFLIFFLLLAPLSSRARVLRNAASSLPSSSVDNGLTNDLSGVSPAFHGPERSGRLDVRSVFGITASHSASDHLSNTSSVASDVGVLLQVLPTQRSNVSDHSTTTPTSDGQVFTVPTTCQPEDCAVFYSHYGYRPSFLANVSFVIAWILLGIFHIAEVLVLHKWTFACLVIAGCTMEAAGYVARIFSYEYPTLKKPYFIQLTFLTMAPVLFSAACYLCLSATIRRVSTEFSRHQPTTYDVLFTIINAISLIAQAAGVGIAFWRSAVLNDGPGYAAYVLIGGLAVQTLAMSFFFVMFLDYGIDIFKRRRLFKQRAQHELESTEIHRLIWSKVAWTCWGSLLIATAFLLVRCSYHLWELTEGWYGPTHRNEGVYIGMESTMVTGAVLLLMLGHPGLLEEKYQGIRSEYRWHELNEIPAAPRIVPQ